MATKHDEYEAWFNAGMPDDPEPEHVRCSDGFINHCEEVYDRIEEQQAADEMVFIVEQDYDTL